MAEAASIDLATIVAVLPPAMREGLTPTDPEQVLVAVMHELLAPAEQAMLALPRICDPRGCPDRFVPMLLRWLDLDRIFQGDQAVSADPQAHRSSCPLGRVREVIAIALESARWRGTATGMRLLLGAATGQTGWRISETVDDIDGLPRPFHIRVAGPAEAAPHRALVGRIVVAEKPAYVTAELQIGDEAPELVRMAGGPAPDRARRRSSR